MKKILAAVIAAVMVLSLCACGSSSKTATEASDKRVITIATSPDFPPFESLEGTEVVGIEIELLKAICDKMGAELKIEQMDFDSVLPGIQAGKYDVGVSGITVTEQRKKNVLFTDPYCLAAQAIVVNEGSPIQSKADLAGKKVAVQSGTTAESYCMENGYEVNSYQANNDAEAALLAGKVDAWVIDDLTAAEMVKSFNAEGNGTLVILSEAMTTEPYALALKFGNEALVEEINGIIAGLVADGSVKGFFEQFDAPFTAPN